MPKLVVDNMHNILLYATADKKTLLALAYRAAKNPAVAKMMVAEIKNGNPFSWVGDYVLENASPSAVQRADELLKTVLLQANEIPSTCQS